METKERQDRLSPVVMDGRPQETRLENGWQVVLSYADTGLGPFLVDLSHRRKWDVQDVSLETLRPWNLRLPASPGLCRFEEGRLSCRRTQRQATVWDLADDGPQEAAAPCCTDVTDGICLLALVGPGVFSVMEKVCSLDLAPSAARPPFLVQGPVLHVPCRLVILAREATSSVVLTAFARGYGQAMAEALLEAGQTLGLRPGGEDDFLRALHTVRWNPGTGGEPEDGNRSL